LGKDEPQADDDKQKNKNEKQGPGFVAGNFGIREHGKG
jgi:hypothetical protein